MLAARFNEAISEKLLDGALGAFATHGVPRKIRWTPTGSPARSSCPRRRSRWRGRGRYAGIVCVGVVIKGETPHWDYVASAAAQGIGRAALDTGVPISFGVITALTSEQAWARAGGAVGNRGEEAALATLQMAGWLYTARRGQRRGQDTTGAPTPG